MSIARPTPVRIALLLALLLVPPPGVSAQSVPTTINYQGRLLQNTADQDAVTGAVNVVFSIWSGPASDGSAVELWTEPWTGVALSNGIFSVLLGSNGSPIDPVDFQGDSSLYLQLEVDGEVLLPRQQLGSAPFALVDEPENELQDLSLTGDSLGLSESAATVDLSPYLDDTDQQDLALAGTTLSLTNDPTSVDLSGFLDNTDVQTLGLSGDILTISGSGSSVDVSGAATVADLVTRVSAAEADLQRTVFVSSQTYDGNLGGLAGADALCQGLADAASLDGTFRAWLSDLADGPSSRFFQDARDYVLVDGTPVAASWSDLTDGSIQNPIALDETGAAAGGAVWTGTATDGTATASRCGDWASNSGGTPGGTGTAGAVGTTWTQGAASGCDALLRLYCFEQFSSDGTDDQKLTLAGTDLELTSDDGTDVVSLASFLDDTDTQDLSLSGSTLSLTNSPSVSLAAFLDDTDTQDLSLSGSILSLTSSPSVSLAAFLDNTDSQGIASVLANGTDAADRDITNLDDVDIDQLAVQNTFTCDAASANCIDTQHIEQDAILGNDITDRIFILHIDCNGSCANMSMREACDVIENLRGISFEVELMDVSCIHSVPSTSGNRFVPCDDGTEIYGDYECRAFELRTLGDIPCVNGEGTDAIVTCYETDIPK